MLQAEFSEAVINAQFHNHCFFAHFLLVFHSLAKDTLGQIQKASMALKQSVQTPAPILALNLAFSCEALPLYITKAALNLFHSTFNYVNSAISPCLYVVS